MDDGEKVDDGSGELDIVPVRESESVGELVLSSVGDGVPEYVKASASVRSTLLDFVGRRFEFDNERVIDGVPE